MKNRFLKSLHITSFILYSIVCIWIYFFKCNIGKDLYFLYRNHSFSFDPFSELISNGQFNPNGLLFIFLNILGFILHGFLAAQFFKGKKIWFGILISFGLTLFIEMMQFALKFGGGNIGDIFFNTFGGCIGTLIYYFTYRKIKNIVFNVFHLVVSVISIALIIVGIIFTIQKWPEYTYFLTHEITL